MSRVVEDSGYRPWRRLGLIFSILEVAFLGFGRCEADGRRISYGGYQSFNGGVSDVMCAKPVWERSLEANMSTMVHPIHVSYLSNTVPSNPLVS